MTKHFIALIYATKKLIPIKYNPLKSLLTAKIVLFFKLNYLIQNKFF